MVLNRKYLNPLFPAKAGIQIAPYLIAAAARMNAAGFQLNSIVPFAESASPLDSRFRGNERRINLTILPGGVRDDEDLNKHVDYVHFNPVKHEYVSSPDDWPYSTWHEWKKILIGP